MSGAQNNAFTFHFIEQDGGNLDPRTRTAVRSFAAKETRRRRRVQYQTRRAPKNLLPKTRKSPAASQPSKTRWWLSLHGKSSENDREDPSSPSSFMPMAFDPFASMVEVSPLLSSIYSKDLEIIQTHAIEFCFPGTSKTVIFPEALRTPALLGSILYMAYANLSSHRGWSNPRLALALKTAAISHVNKKLSHPSTATCTNVIASVAYLSTGTWIFGDEPQETSTHLSGIQLMVQNRGMESLGVYEFGRTVQKYLFVQHAVTQAMSALPPSPIFNFDYAHAADGLDSTISSTVNLHSNQHRVGASKMPKKEITSILLDTKSIIDALVVLYEGLETSSQDEKAFILQYRLLKVRIESSPSASSPDTPCYGDYVYESVRLSSLLIMNAIESRVPLNRTSQTLASNIQSALRKTDLLNAWGDLVGVLYWVLMTAAAALRGRGGNGERTMGALLASTMCKATLEDEDLASAIKPVEVFGALQIALRKRSEAAAQRGT